MNEAIKIAMYQIRRSGISQTVALPPTWTDDLGLKPGDMLEMYRDKDDRLILIPKDARS